MFGIAAGPEGFFCSGGQDDKACIWKLEEEKEGKVGTVLLKTLQHTETVEFC